ncbi:hypothetical protein AFLA_001157 [Aspergillus flavus NRRL3357]|nr:hypothetical protein AFLA_001157 [Aspergillus flavus NRRL3357]
MNYQKLGITSYALSYTAGDTLHNFTALSPVTFSDGGSRGNPLFPSLIRIGFGLLELRQGLGLWWFSSLQYTRVVRI